MVLISGYWQVKVADEDKEKTAFCTPDGFFEFNVMPFGMSNAPATFQRLMDVVLSGLQWSTCLVCIDDLVIRGKTFGEHLQYLKEVLQRLRESNLKLQPPKCHLFQRKVDLLGHVVSSDGIATDPAKMKQVAQWPVPNTRREVQQFLGLAGYYRRFIQVFSTVARPLHRLTEKNARFKWTDECQRAFVELRQRLVEAPVLAFPDFSGSFVLDTDAGIGAVLSQLQEDGGERVVAYASRVLSKPERRYCATRKVLLAVVTFIKHFRPYLLGKQFTLRTDHSSLTWLFWTRDPEGQLARWLERLQEYDFTIEHRAGPKHVNADAMSRLPCTQCGRSSHDEDADSFPGLDSGRGSHEDADSLPGSVSVSACTRHKTDPLPEMSQEDWRKVQLEDPTVGFVLRAMEKGEKPRYNLLKTKSLEARLLVQRWRKLEVIDGVLWRRFEDDRGRGSYTQLVVPRALRDGVLGELHAGVVGGHLGEDTGVGSVEKEVLLAWVLSFGKGLVSDLWNLCYPEIRSTQKSCSTANYPGWISDADYSS